MAQKAKKKLGFRGPQANILCRGELRSQQVDRDARPRAMLGMSCWLMCRCGIRAISPDAAVRPRQPHAEFSQPACKTFQMTCSETLGAMLLGDENEEPID